MIASILPAAGPIFGGTEVSVVGSGFSSLLEYRCVFGDITVSALPASPSLIECEESPAVEQPGAVSFHLQIVKAGVLIGDHRFLYYSKKIALAPVFTVLFKGNPM